MVGSVALTIWGLEGLGFLGFRGLGGPFYFEEGSV